MTLLLACSFLALRCVAWPAYVCQVIACALSLDASIMCLTVPDFVLGVLLLVSGGCSVLLVHIALLSTLNNMCWARLLQKVRYVRVLVSLPCHSLTSGVP